MKTSTFEKIVLSPPNNVSPKASIIWLHGLGADGHDFVPVARQLNLPERLGVRFIFPHAPVRPVTLNAGMEMPAWFDLFGLGVEYRHDEEGLMLANQQLVALIEEEHALGIPAEKIIIAGFSQGGALALYTGMTYPQKLAGILALSTYLPLSELYATHFPYMNLETPIFMAHGMSDPVIPVNLGEMSRDRLSSLGFSIEWHTYPMMHSVCDQEIRDIAEWLNQRLA